MGFLKELGKAILEVAEAENRKQEAMRKAAATQFVFADKTSLLVMNSFQRRLSVKTPSNIRSEIVLTRESFELLKKKVSSMNYSDLLKLTVVNEGIGIYSVEAVKLV